MKKIYGTNNSVSFEDIQEAIQTDYADDDILIIDNIHPFVGDSLTLDVILFLTCIKGKLQMRIKSKSEPKKRSVSYYAERLYITPKYMSTTVKKISGKTALEWINEYVIEDIKRQLAFSSKSIKEIADYLMFPSISFFGKYVKKHLGVSPKEFRRQLGKE